MWNSFVFVCCLTAKIMNKIKQYIFKHLQSNDVSPVFLLPDLDIPFWFKMFKICEFVRFCMLTEAKIMKKFSNTQSTICDQMAQVLLFSSLTYIFDFKFLKYVKFIHFRILPEAKIMKKNQQYAFKHLWSNALTPVFLLVLDVYFQFQMFKICEIRSFWYVAG